MTHASASRASPGLFDDPPRDYLKAGGPPVIPHGAGAQPHRPRPPAAPRPRPDPDRARSLEGPGRLRLQADQYAPSPYDPALVVSRRHLALGRTSRVPWSGGVARAGRRSCPLDDPRSSRRATTGTSPLAIGPIASAVGGSARTAASTRRADLEKRLDDLPGFLGTWDAALLRARPPYADPSPSRFRPLDLLHAGPAVVRDVPTVDGSVAASGRSSAPRARRRSASSRSSRSRGPRSRRPRRGRAARPVPRAGRRVVRGARQTLKSVSSGSRSPRRSSRSTSTQPRSRASQSVAACGFTLCAARTPRHPESAGSRRITSR